MKTTKPIFLLLALAAIVFLSAAAFKHWGNSADTFVLSGHTPAQIKSAVPVEQADLLPAGDKRKRSDTLVLIGRNNPVGKVRMAMKLEPRNKEELEALVQARGDKLSPDFNTRLSASQFIAKYSPSQDDYELVKAYILLKGFTIDQEYANRLLIVFSGQSQQVEQAFQIHLNQYQQDGRNFICNDEDPRLPVNLKGIVGAIVGLNDNWRFLSRAKLAPEMGSNSSAAHTPQDIATIYGFPNINNRNGGTAYSGSGYNLAVCTAFTYDHADAQAFWAQFHVNHGYIDDQYVGGKAAKTDPETTLDLELSSAQAPGANIIMYMGVDNGFGLLMALNQCAVDNRADAVSFSWGMSEDTYGAAVMQAYHVVFMEMAAQGMPVFAASGDDGAYEDKTAGTKEMTVCYPASDPLVTAVGGTSLNVNVFGLRSSEKAWTGSGGGVSKYWPRPAWQNAPGMEQNTLRNSADVALDGDPATGYVIRYQGKWYRVGGTSCGAPNWAALWVLAEEACRQRLGCATQFVYRLAQTNQYYDAFMDITEGNNGNNKGPGYNAGSGYDHPTGLGVPNGAELVRWLQEDCRPGH